MIHKMFPTVIYEEDGALDASTLQALHDCVIMTGSSTQPSFRSVILMSEEVPALHTLREIITDRCTTFIKEHYMFDSVYVSTRFASHYYPPRVEGKMETHSDDLGDYGRKFIALFYLEAEEAAGGELELFDPRWLNGAWHQYTQTAQITPKTNKLVIFPTFLWHRVKPYNAQFLPRMLLDVVIRVENND